MKLIATTAALCLALAATPALANGPTEKDAIAMVERGAALIKAKGKDEMIKKINAKEISAIKSTIDGLVRDVFKGKSPGSQRICLRDGSEKEGTDGYGAIASNSAVSAR